MKKTLLAVVVLAVLAGCKKDISETPESLSATVASDALQPLPCHSTSFISDYIIQPGQVPPFRFTKTLYPDTRVRTIDVLSRKYPIYSGYKVQAEQITGHFSYSPNRAYLKGYRYVREYFKTATGGAGERLISRSDVNLKFYITPQGYCTRVTDMNIPTGPLEKDERLILEVGFWYDHPHQIASVYLPQSAQEIRRQYEPVYDEHGNLLTLTPTFNPNISNVTYTYDYSIPRGSKNYSFIPSQNLISQEYSLLEIMQWLPHSKHQRKNVSGAFYLPNGQKITQSQYYKNFIFDSKGNQTSVTYGDNIAQKTTWFCN